MAQTLKFGNGNFATKAGSTLCYDDQNGNFKPIPMDFTRASTATRVNKQGLIEVVKSNVPRIDYTDTSDGVLLLEKAATNLLPYSNDFSNSAWGKTNVTLTSNAVISPDGTQNASKIVAIGSDGSLQDSITVTSGTTYTLSVYLKTVSGTLDTAISLGSPGFPQNEGEGGRYKNITVTNEWKRYTLTSTADASAATGIGVGGFNSFSTSEQVYVYGAQFEVGSFPTSYIPTQGSAVTRVAETANNSGNSEVFNDSEGVLFADIAYLNPTTSPNSRIAISDGTALNRILIQNVSSTSNRLQFYVISNGVSSTDFFTDLSDITLFNKIVFKYKTNDFSVWINGFEVLTDTSGSTFSDGTLNELAFDGGDGTSDFYGKTKEIGYYNTILTDLELETLTSYKSWTSMVNELNLNIIYNG